MHQLWTRFALTAAVMFACVAVHTSAEAFCGFYVSGASDDLVNDASSVVLMRDGRRTVLSMQNDYKGPVEDFALVVPVPQVLEEENVRTLPNDVFDRVDAMGAPRLVEYWERDPCAQPTPAYAVRRQGVTESAEAVPEPTSAAPSGVRIEAQFEVAEYQIVVLSSDDSSALDTWLRENGYSLPDGASELLRPYVESGMYFFAAKVDVEKIQFDDEGTATLSPLRFHYDSDDFELPIRLGFINADGPQDLIVNILATEQRYDVANYENTTIPTNLFVDEQVKSSFSTFYLSLFERTLAESPGTVVTEYSWNAATCDPCPGATLTPEDLLTLGGDSFVDEERSRTPRLIQNVSYIDTELNGRGTLSQGELAVSFGFVDDAQLAACLRSGEQRTTSTPERGSDSVEIGFELTPEGDLAHIRSQPDLDAETKDCVANVFREVDLPAPTGGSSIVKTTWRVARQSAPPQRIAPTNNMNFVLTRLHARLDAEHFREDLVFRRATPIEGGRGGATELDKGAVIARTNQFQGRYIIRHPWEGEVSCDEPNYGVWGGPPAGRQRPTVTASRTDENGNPPDLSTLVLEDIEQIGLKTTAAQPQGDEDADDGSDGPVGSPADVSGEERSVEIRDDEPVDEPREIEHVPWSGEETESCSTSQSNSTGAIWLLLAFFARRAARRSGASNDNQEIL